MKVTTKEFNMFDPHIKCDCGGVAELAFVVKDEQSEIAGNPPEGGNWPACPVGVGVYFCMNCMKSIAEWDNLIDLMAPPLAYNSDENGNLVIAEGYEEAEAKFLGELEKMNSGPKVPFKESFNRDDHQLDGLEE